MLQLLGDSPETADKAAEAILALETRLAEASLTNVELRDLENYYNIKTGSDDFYKRLGSTTSGSVLEERSPCRGEYERSPVFLIKVVKMVKVIVMDMS